MSWEGTVPSHCYCKVIILKHEPEGVSARALAVFASRVQRVLGLKGEVNIRVTDNREMRGLNLRFRKKSKATDVLSFVSDMPGVDGDIAISAEIATENAAKLLHPVSTELKILILHGLLHIAGYDHETDNGEMLAQEAILRSQLGLPATLIERTHHLERRGGALLPRTGMRTDAVRRKRLSGGRKR